MTIPASVAEHPSAPALEVSLHTFGRVCVITLRGDLCASSLPVLERKFDELGCTSCREVTLDLADLHSVDDAGCRVLTGLHHYVAARGGTLTMAGANGWVRDALATSPIACR